MFQFVDHFFAFFLFVDFFDLSFFSPVLTVLDLVVFFFCDDFFTNAFFFGLALLATFFVVFIFVDCFLISVFTLENEIKFSTL